MTLRFFGMLGLVAAVLCLGTLATTGAQAAKENEECGGLVGIKCDEGLWCDPQQGTVTGQDNEKINLCGAMDLLGVCKKVPCDEVNIVDVCGCDGMTYTSDCKRRMAKVQKDHDGACKKQ